MDLATLIGLVFGFVMLVGGFIMEGGAPTALIAVGSLMFVVGGTVGACIVGNPMSFLKQLPSYMGMIFKETKGQNPDEIITAFEKLASKARREGLIALQGDMSVIPDPFFTRGLELLLDGTDDSVVVDVLDSEVESVDEHYKKGIKFWEMAGSYFPTFGICGTALTMIVIMGMLGSSDASELGHKIGVAFTATIYGLAFANLVCFPFGEKLKARQRVAVQNARLIAVGLLSIKQGTSPAVLRQKLEALLDPTERPAGEAK